MKLQDFDEDTILTLSRIGVIRSIIDGLYDDIGYILKYINERKATSYITNVDDNLKQLRDYIIEEVNKKNDNIDVE